MCAGFHVATHVLHSICFSSFGGVKPGNYSAKLDAPPLPNSGSSDALSIQLAHHLGTDSPAACIPRISRRIRAAKALAAALRSSKLRLRLAYPVYPPPSPRQAPPSCSRLPPMAASMMNGYSTPPHQS